MTTKKSKSLRVAEKLAAVIGTQFTISVAASLAPSFDENLPLETARFVTFPESRVSEVLTRGTQRVTYQTAFNVLERIAQADMSTLDRADILVQLLEDVGEFLLGQIYDINAPITDVLDFQLHLTEYEHSPLYDRLLLEDNRVMGGTILITGISQESIRT